MHPAHRNAPLTLVCALALSAASAPALASAAVASTRIALGSPQACDGTAAVAIGQAFPLRIAIGAGADADRARDGHDADPVRLDLHAVDPTGRVHVLAQGARALVGLTYALDVPVDGAPGAWSLTARTAESQSTCTFTAVPAAGPRLEAPSEVVLTAPSSSALAPAVEPMAGDDDDPEGAVSSTAVDDTAASSTDAPAGTTRAPVRRAVTLHNRGDAPLAIRTIAIAGGGRSPFAALQDAPLPMVIPAGGARDVLLSFRPPASGAASDVLVLRTDDPEHSAVGIPLLGWAAGAQPLTPVVATARGCREEGALPVWFVGEPIGARLQVIGDRADDGAARGAGSGALSARARVAAVLRDGTRTATMLRLPRIGAARASDATGRGVEAPTAESARIVVASIDLQALVAELEAPGRTAVDTCSVLVAAPVSRVAGHVNAPDGPTAVGGLTAVLSGPEPQSTRTDAAGAFAFDIAQPGEHVVTIMPPAGRSAAKARFTIDQAGASVAPLTLDLVESAERVELVKSAERADLVPPADPAFDVEGAATAPDQQPACSAAISPRDGVVNVGQTMTFRATASPTRGTYTYRWTIEGEVIRDYSEGSAAPWRTMPLVPANLADRTVSFLWRPDDSQRYPRNDGPVARRVRVDVSDGRGGACSDQVTLQVERNETASTRQAEDWYTSNHQRFITREHTLWHDRYPFDAPFYDGTIFFDFHAQFVDRFDRWRAEFGYPPIGIWDPAMPIPAGIDIEHRPRSASYAGQPRPGWATLSGGGPRGWNLMPCDWTRGGQRILADFPRDRRLLGCAVTETWHNNVHLILGGDMQDPPTSPRDPVFWRWHRYVELVSRDRLSLWQAELAADGVLPAPSAERPFAPPQPAVVYQVPFRLYDFVTSLEAIEVTFDAPVTGVAAGALSVGGVPATFVSGAGAGPYRFIGHGAPVGATRVRLDGRAIRSAEGAVALDAEWTQTVLLVDEDLDGDGLTNGEEIHVVLSRPDVADSDGDGLSDAAEWGLHDTLPRWRDSDGDGASDGCEVAAGSGPNDAADQAAGCAPEPVWLCSAP